MHMGKMHITYDFYFSYIYTTLEVLYTQNCHFYISLKYEVSQILSPKLRRLLVLRGILFPYSKTLERRRKKEI